MELPVDFLALWKHETMRQAIWPLEGKRKAEELMAGNGKRRRCSPLISKDPTRMEPENEMAMFGAVGASCVADLPVVLASLGWLAALLALLLVLLCFSESILATLICTSMLGLMAMVSMANQVLSISYEGAWAI
ncbi:unnamed protein product [Cladocopium goreaui]|uniref:Uncharacterized protein n=1 Tax=Cladocopium goreaui TaxID=2562237 RepID=A0A9P1FTD5_9DINO|nr:unnamed protein product [Cladocopium goreaui]|mmetsp:Transcript_77631/g.171486  ORF Transcript_77631/g.171486 Transcript_77631/m.171486 type:complete len:134 (+) Transcript_77631:64-465(+)